MMPVSRQIVFLSYASKDDANKDKNEIVFKAF